MATWCDPDHRSTGAGTSARPGARPASSPTSDPRETGVGAEAPDGSLPVWRPGAACLVLGATVWALAFVRLWSILAG